jgi:hypothetical protein
METIPPEVLLERVSPELRLVADTLRTLVRRAVPDAIERVRPGWGIIGYDVPLGRRTAYFGFVWPEPEHVHLGFEHGISMDVADGVLQGTGKRVRWVTLRHLDEIEAPMLEGLVREAVRVARLSRAEREAAAMDRVLRSALPAGAR